jgi:hypothetical protein
LGGESALPADSDESYSDLEDDLPHIPAPGITTENPENSSMRQ